ncbi:hypothetical protein OPQ81_002962 [Rhizoctonia solani]|nr:hypothetical protein OPQ81_002962 [Rhizoctonia solani]
MSDPAQTSQGQTPDQGLRAIDPARLKAMKGDLEAKYAGTQEALKRNEQMAKEDKGLRAKHMEGIFKHLLGSNCSFSYHLPPILQVIILLRLSSP